MCKTIKQYKNLIVAKQSKMMFLFCFVLFLGGISFTVCSCGKKYDKHDNYLFDKNDGIISIDKNDGIIRVDNLDTICNLSFFKGIRPGMLYDDVVALVGKPNEHINLTYEGRKYRDFIYYCKEGKIRCSWTGKKSDRIDDVEYIPYENIYLSLDEVLKWPIEKCEKVDILISSRKDNYHLTICQFGLKIKYLKLSGFGNVPRRLSPHEYKERREREKKEKKVLYGY